MIERFEIVPLAATHDRTLFDSGAEPLDRYFRHQVTQDIRRRVSACFVALAPISNGEQRIAAYYTLASASLPLADLPPTTAKKLPRYPSVPAVRMGRLAVDQGFKGRVLAVRCSAMRWSVLAVRKLRPTPWSSRRRMRGQPPSIGIMPLSPCRIRP